MKREKREFDSALAEEERKRNPDRQNGRKR